MNSGITYSENYFRVLNSGSLCCKMTGVLVVEFQARSVQIEEFTL